MYLSKEELHRMEQADIGMPFQMTFLVRVGEYVMKIGYSPDREETLNDRMKQYIRKIAEIKYQQKPLQEAEVIVI